MVATVDKDQTITLPRMGATDANIIRIAGGDFPTRRHVHWLLAIFNSRVIVDFVAMKRHVQVGAIALKKKGNGRRRKIEHACVQRRALTSMQLLKSTAS